MERTPRSIRPNAVPVRTYPIEETRVGMTHASRRGTAAAAVFLLLVISAGTAPAAERIDQNAHLSKIMPVLLEFGKGWCIPCKHMKPILDDVARLYAGRAVVKSVDMDANRHLVRTFRIRLMPTQVFLLPDGKEFFRNEGTLERPQIVKVFSKMGLPPPRQTRGPAR
jgi:thioredoxin 1